MGHDKASEEEIIKSIEEGTEFHGAKLWILVLAIFVASLGLNTNSAAVIIGAMLISPLMGPILGMGLGVGVYDFELFKQALRNYLITTIFSVCTAFVYFSISPLTEAQSELLARTSPTIYDVCIALCGGLAGIVALSSKSQRTGNVIPGVAIATALMPPLCTVGYGLAMHNWSYAGGAFYLYLINTVFIALSTYLGVVFILRMHKKKQVDQKSSARVRRIILSIVLITIIPSIYFTMGIVKDTVFEQHVRLFVQSELNYENTHVLSYSCSRKDQEIRMILIGETLDSVRVNKLKENLPQYNLYDVQLNVLQGTNNLTENEIRTIISDKNEATIMHQADMQKNIDILEEQINKTKEYEKLTAEIYPEILTLFPCVDEFALLKGVNYYNPDSTKCDTTFCAALVGLKSKITNEEKLKMESWLLHRTKMPHVTLVIK